MSIKDPTIAKYRDDEISPEQAALGSGMGGVSNYPASPSPSFESPAGANLKDLLVTKKDLQDAADTKKKTALIGALGDTLASSNGFGNFLTGHLNQASHTGRDYAKQQADQADQPIAAKQMLQKQTEQTPALQTSMDAMDKESDYSKAKRAELSSTIGALQKYGQLDPDKAQALTSSLENMNGYQAGKILESLKPVNDVLKSQAMLAMTGKRLGMQEDKTAAGAAAGIDNDNLVKQFSTQRAQISKGLGLLQSNTPMTGQTAAEEAANFAAILAGAKGAGLEQANKMEYSSLQGNLAKFQQWATGHPQDAMPPELRASMAEQYQRLDGAIAGLQAQRAKSLAIGRNYSNTPAAQQAMQQKVQSYQVPADAGAQAPEPSPQDAMKYKAALQEIKAIQADPSATPEQKLKAAKGLAILAKKAGLNGGP